MQQSHSRPSAGVTPTDVPAAATVRTAVLGLLRPCGMTTIFGNPGSTEPAMLRELPEDFRRPPPANPCRSPTCCKRSPNFAVQRTFVVEEAPSARSTMQAYQPFTRSETFYAMCSGGLGWSMPAAVGIALARPHAKVIALIGRRLGDVFDPGAVECGTARHVGAVAACNCAYTR